MKLLFSLQEYCHDETSNGSKVWASCFPVRRRVKTGYVMK
jgi:hypothetical protein